MQFKIPVSEIFVLCQDNNLKLITAFPCSSMHMLQYSVHVYLTQARQVKVGNDLEMAHSERNSHSKNPGGGEKTKSKIYTEKTYRKPEKNIS